MILAQMSEPGPDRSIDKAKGVRALGAALVISAPEALRVVQPREMLLPGGEGEAPAYSALR
jgi:hypothetical protein